MSSTRTRDELVQTPGRVAKTPESDNEIVFTPILSRARQIGFSIADQGFAVGGMFLVNIALARTQSKEQYGVFALSYSIFTFLSGVHNAALLEAYTVYGSGRHNRRLPIYAAKFLRVNAILCLALAAVVAVGWRILSWKWPTLASPTILGLAVACGFILTAAFIRRTFYIRRRADLAAKFSFVFFLMCLVFLSVSVRTGILNGFIAFLIIALAWLVAGLSLLRELPQGRPAEDFLQQEPGYWTEHWRYCKWVVATAFVFQFSSQGYYWLSAGFLSVKEVGDLRAVYNLVSPIDQIFIAMSLLILPRMAQRYTAQQMTGLVPLWRAYSVGIIAITLGFAALANILGARVMHLLYGGKFDDIAPLLGILAFLPVMMGVGNAINDALKSAEKPMFVFYAYLCSGAVTFAAGIPLVMHFGLRGEVYSMLLSGTGYTVTLFVFFIALNSRRIAIARTPPNDSLIRERVI